jgi:hypothetical protein
MKFQLTREMQIGTKEFFVVKDKESDAVAYVYTSKNGKPAAAVFYGKSNKPVSRFYYANDHMREVAITRSFESRRISDKWKQERKAERAKPHTLKIGDILSGSWGYDQTNIDFFEVVATTEHSVTVRPLAQQKQENGWMRGTCLPVPGKYTGEATTHRCSAGNCIKSPVHGSASMWDGHAENWTAYA